MSRWRRGAQCLAVAVAFSTCGPPATATLNACTQAQSPEEANFARARARLIDTLRAEGIDDERVLEALSRVRRHEFVDARWHGEAYGNYPLPIGHDQTISQPYIVALMTQILSLQPGERVLEIGTGSGYQAAVLAELGCAVFSIELLPELAASAAQTLSRLGYTQVHLRVGDGYLGWPEEAPFDAIIVTAAPPETPAALVEQLGPGGRMVLPLGDQSGYQMLTLVEKDAAGKVSSRNIAAVRFVPMVKRKQQ